MTVNNYQFHGVSGERLWNDLLIGQRRKIDDKTEVLRVPSGWVVTLEYKSEKNTRAYISHCVFVPDNGL